MTQAQQLTLGVILPHTKIFGGVKRFFEIGNILISKGHRFIVFTPEGKAPDWFPFQGDVATLVTLSDYAFDALFITEPEYLDHLRRASTAVRIFYAVLQRRYIKNVADMDDIIVLANSGALYDYLGGDSKQNVIKCIGGIDANKFQYRQRSARKPGEPFVIMVYGRFYRRKKGTGLVVRACEKLYRDGYNIKLLLFDAPVDELARRKVEAFRCTLPFEFFVDYPVSQLADLYYKADLFVSAERNAGWSNTSAEAMACGVPVVATRSGTQDFLVHRKTGLLVWRHPWFIRRGIAELYEDVALRYQLAEQARRKIEDFSWKTLADNIEESILCRRS